MIRATNIGFYNKLIIGLIVGETFIRKYLPIGGVVLIGILTFMLFMILLLSYRGKYSNYSTESAFPLLSLFLLCCIQVAGLSPQLKAIILAWLLFIVVFLFSNYNIVRVSSIKASSYIVSLIGIINCLSIGGFSLLTSDVREEMLIDKGGLTLWFAIALCISFVHSIAKGLKSFSTVIFVVVLLTNVLVIQSKTSLLAFVIFFIILFVFSEKTIKKKLLRYALPICIVYGALAISNPTEYIPHTFIVAINQIAGSDIIPVYTNKYDTITYNARELIDLYCTNLFLENPIAGIGLGNYELLRSTPTGVTECENTYYDLLVNGGCLYGLPVIYILAITLIRAIRLIVKSKNIMEYYYILATLVAIIVCFRYNDFLHVNVFMFIGICYYFCKNQDRLQTLK